MKTKNTIKHFILVFALFFSVNQIILATGGGSWNYIISGHNVILPDTTNAITVNPYLGWPWLDEGIVNLQWPFNFSIYDNNYSTNDTISINTNGYIRFDDLISISARYVPIPNIQYGQFLSYGGNTDGKFSSSMKYKVSGSTPNQILTIVIPYNTDYNPTNNGGYEADIFISFYEVNNSILMQYKNVVIGSPIHHANYLGINSGDNTFYSNLGYFPTNDTAFLFTPSSSGSVMASGSWNYIITAPSQTLPDTSNSLTLNLSSGSMDDGIAFLAWPFNFSVYDNNYTTNDSITISTNGFIRFDGLMAHASQTGQIPSSNSLYGQFLSYGGDTDGEVQSPIKYKSSGTAPNRILTIIIPYNTDYDSTGYKADIYISFHESNKTIKVIYKNTVVGTTNYANEIGMNAGDNTFYSDLGNFPTSDTAYLYSPPTFGALDAGITHVFISGNGVGNRTLSARLNCYGTTTLTSDTIQWSVNSMMQPYYAWTGNLPQTNKDTVPVGVYNFSTPGQYTIKAWTTKPNGGVDTDTSNDSAEITVIILPYQTLPLSEDFELGFSNFDNAIGNYVDFTLSTSFFHSKSQCAHNAHTSTNENILHETGLLDLSNSSNPYLDFYHIAKTEGNWDYCYVEISTDGGISYTVLPDSAYLGNSLDYATKGYFHEDSYSIWGTSNTTPDNATWWKYEKFDLKDYKVNNVRIRFNLVSDGSTNRAGWFIDDIKIYDPYYVSLGFDTSWCTYSTIPVYHSNIGVSSYIWKSLPNNDTLATTPYYIPVESGTYVVIINTINGGSGTDTINITLLPSLELKAFGTTTICNGDSALIYATGNNLFFSEYIEGSSYNKAFEIYNGTGLDVDLSNYLILQNTNGGPLDEYVDQLAGILLAGDVYVIAHPSANSSILAVADTTDSYIANFNGDDMRALAKIITDNSQTDTITFNSNIVYVKVLDYIGEYPNDPGVGWNVAGETNATVNHTLVRKPEVYSPKRNWNLIAGIDSSSSEWIVYPQDYFVNLGTHNYTNPNFAYLWSNNATTQSITVNPSISTTYQVTVTSHINCWWKDSVQVNVSSPVVNLGKDTMFMYDSLSILLDAGVGFSSYIWSTGDTTQTIIVTGVDITMFPYWIDTVSVIVIDSFGCLTSDTIIISLYYNSINENQNDINFKIYPIPTDKIITIEFENPERIKQLQIINMNGQMLSSIQGTSESKINIDLSGYQKGIYIIRIINDKSIINKKIVLK